MAELFPEDMKFAEEIGAGEENLAEAEMNEPQFGRGWRFDYDTGEFILTPTGKVAGAEGTDSWLEWCRKTIHTPRYRHLIYSRDYGHEMEELLGSGLTREAYESEIQRMVQEALLMDPRTGRVDSFTFQWEDERCTFTCEVASSRDEAAQLTGSVVI